MDYKRIIKAVLKGLGERELETVRRLVGSRTLNAAMSLIITESEQRADLFVPHYWAVWYHDGRGPVQPVNARKLVFFDNKNDDPRLRGGRYPVKESQVRTLTRAQYEDGLRINQERRRRGQRPFMYVVDSVGPTKGNPFFETLAKGAVARANRIVPRIFERELLRQLDADKDTKSEHKVARFRIR